MKLSDEQKNVIQYILESTKKQQVTTCGGYAGTGKSTIVQHLCQLMKNWAVCAYTGKAAHVLRKKGVMDASTIHSLIYVPEKDVNGNIVLDKYGSPIFILNPNLLAEGIIIDEASMVSKEIFEDLKSFNIPLLFVGDHGQLEPIGSDVHLMKNPDFKLETIHRNAGEIAHFAEFIRKGYRPAAFANRNPKSIFFVTRKEAEKYYTKVDQIICGFNKTRVEINKRVRQILGYEDNWPKVGEKIMCLRNSRMNGLFNGMQGEVTTLFKYHKNKMIFSSDGQDYEIFFDPHQFNKEKYEISMDRNDPHPFDFCDAITCHKCVHPDTLVETEQGLLPIKLISKTGIIATPTGPKAYINFVENPKSESLKITTKTGYSLTVTLDHKCEIYDQGEFKMIKASDLKLGDIARLKLGAEFEKQDEPIPELPQGDSRCKVLSPNLTNDFLAEFLGLIVADGVLARRSVRLVKRHEDVADRFAFLTRRLFGIEANKIQVDNCFGYEIHSAIIQDWITSAFNIQPNSRSVPLWILQSSINTQRHFLKGLFEDGWVTLDKKNKNLVDHIGWYSCYEELYNQVKVMLLRMNIVTSCLATETIKKTLYIYGDYIKRFKQDIGFIAKFKNDRLNLEIHNSKDDKIPMLHSEIKGRRKLFLEHFDLYTYQNAISRKFLSRKNAIRLNQLIQSKELADRLNYYYTEINSLELTDSESMCVEVPDGHKFIQNGFPFGNSQGSEYDHGMVIEQRCDLWDFRRWGYTAASRFKKEIFWVSA